MGQISTLLYTLLLIQPNLNKQNTVSDLVLVDSYVKLIKIFSMVPSWDLEPGLDGTCFYNNCTLKNATGIQALQSTKDFKATETKPVPFLIFNYSSLLWLPKSQFYNTM